MQQINEPGIIRTVTWQLTGINLVEKLYTPIPHYFVVSAPAQELARLVLAERVNLHCSVAVTDSNWTE